MGKLRIPNWSFVMKKIVSAFAVVALMAPSVASATTAAGALSVKSAAVQPTMLRAAAKPGRITGSLVKNSGFFVGLAVAGAFAGFVAIADDSDSK